METLDPNMTASYFTQAIEAYSSRNYGVVIAGMVMLVVWITRTFLIKQIPKEYLSWVAALAGVAMSMAANVFAGMNWVDATIYGLLVGSSASGLWDMVGKRFLNKANQK